MFTRNNIMRISITISLFALILIFTKLGKSSEILKSQTMSLEKNSFMPTSDTTQVITGLIVRKPFINKIGKTSEFKEMYFRLSVQDYFIKFCESKITKADLQAHLDRLPESGPSGDKAVTLEIEIKNGEWDSCDEEYPIQSRVGDYIVIHRIVD